MTLRILNLKNQITTKLLKITPHIFAANSSTITYTRIQQKISTTKNFWTILLLLESPENKNFQTPDLEINL